MGDASYIFEKPWENFPEKSVEYASHEEAQEYFEEIERIGELPTVSSSIKIGKPIPAPLREALIDGVEAREGQRKLKTKDFNPIVQYDIGAKLDRGETSEILVGDKMPEVPYPPVSTIATSMPFILTSFTDPFAQNSKVISAFSKTPVAKKICKVCVALENMKPAERTAVQNAFENTEEWTARAIFDTLTSLGIKVSYDAVKIHRRKEGTHSVFNN